LYQVKLVGRQSAYSILKLPLRILMAIANRRAGERAFNIFTAAGALLGKYGPDRSQKILSASIWAPEWSDAEIATYGAAYASPSALAPNELQVAEFPGTGLLAHPNPAAVAQYPLYDIIHFAGSVRSEGPALNLDNSHAIMAGALRDALVAASTRLLIIQVRDRPENYGWESNVMEMAELVVGAGGPPVLTVVAEENAVVQGYFTDFYANLLHKQILQDAARPNAGLDQSIKANLYCSPGTERILGFDDLVEDTAQRLANIAGLSTPAPADLRNQYAAMLHREDLARFDAALQRRSAKAEPPQSLASRSNDVRNLNAITWHQEDEGIVPLSQAIEVLEAAEGEFHRDLALAAEIEAAATAPPRVLNAAFAKPEPSAVTSQSGGLLLPATGLVAGAEYELWVDIGPRWDKIVSLVKGNANFPETALPPSDEGHVLDVAVISEDFTPRSSVAELWLPNGSGRSSPWVNSRRGNKPGPVKIPLSAPVFREGEAAQSRPAYARLCVYYQNNLLQSAAVRATVVRSEGLPLEAPNTIDVDYVLSGSFQQLDARYSGRAVGFTSGASEGRQPIAASITLNDNGAGGHRIVVKSLADQRPAWMPFDPVAMQQELNDARTNLLRCFYRADPETGEVLRDRAGNGIFGLNSNNGKSREQFAWDLFRLAKFGNRLFNLAFGQINAEEPGVLSSRWARDLRQRLREGQVVQIARVDSVPSQYVFPWSLVYQYPLSGPDSAFHWCKIMKEWSDQGIRTRGPERSCEYEKDPDHQENVLCPYGFWGLKHIIEQPLAGLHLTNGSYVLRDAPNAVLVPPKDRVRLAVGITRDPAIDGSLLSGHLARLAGMPAFQFSPPVPADDVDHVRAMLTAPSIVYFLCHGEFDPGEKQPYLGVGLRDADPAHRVYLQSLQSWFSSAGSRGMDADAWQNRRPLVIINGCHTCNLAPGQILSFASAFGSAGASGVVGTEVAVVLQVAAEVAELLLLRLETVGLGEAVRQVRWELANRGNLAGLAYTAYALADLQVTRMAEPAPFARTVVVAGAGAGGH